MGNYKLDGWADYWKLFEQLCSTLTNNAKEEIVVALKEAQMYVNGLSDGWYEFLNHFQMSVSKHQSQLNPEERELSGFLLSSLKKSLNQH